MESFLKQVANNLYDCMDGNLGHVAVVFPNKRATLFFNEHLVELSDKPLWSPAYLSISELFRSLSSWELGDPIKLVCELYKQFQLHTQSKESLDEFYFWGEMLLSDFDDADKNCIDTDRLFTNLQELKEIMDDYDFLDSEKEAAIQQFFQNFSLEKRTALKEHFISMWDVLGAIYTDFKAALAAQDIAYEGMLYREVIESIDVETLPYTTYVFVGFNVLNQVEQRLFQKLESAGRARFYWDYDHFYLGREKGHEAGEFLRRNLDQFPNSLPSELFNNLSHPKKIHYIAASTENAQARYLPTWIRQNLTTPEKESAIVLCNEALLQPVLHSLPEEVKRINVTMGFPLSQTPIYSFLTLWLDLQITGYTSQTGRFTYQTVVPLLRHSYTSQLSKNAIQLEQMLTKKNRFYPLPSELQKDPFLELLFKPQPDNLSLCQSLLVIMKELSQLYKGSKEGSDTLAQLYQESLFKAYTLVNRFYTLIESGDLKVHSTTFRRLLIKVLSGTNIPFHGEPAIGLQVMGVLETRNLDFRHLVMLSVNEGELPKSGGDTSFIPYNLRKAFGMTTLEHKIAVYAYYFYRLLQRAERVTLLYNTSSDGLNRGEWSRFMLQFLIEYGHPIEQSSLEAAQSPQGAPPIVIPKTAQVMKRMQSRFDLRINSEANFSPSALNTYLDCPLKFYFRYVANLKTPDEVSAEIDSATFGSIFHRAAETLYDELSARSKMIQKVDLETLLKDDIRIHRHVDEAFKKLFFQVGTTEKPEYNGVQLINAEVIARYIKQLLINDLHYAPFTYVKSEEKVYEEIDIEIAGKGKIHSRIGGFIDRLDSKEGTLRIVDYKTGGNASTPKDVESLFVPDKKRSNYIFQTFLYAAILCKKQSQKVAPALLYIHRAANSESYSPVIEMGEARKKLPVDNFAEYETEFRNHLQHLLEEVFNPDLSFEQTKIEGACEYCDYKSFCKR
ncbi:MAG: PD-(D/E)XK nuclease family protein [Phocaeicola sp.]